MFQSQFFNGMVWKPLFFWQCSQVIPRFNPSFSMEWSGGLLSPKIKAIPLLFQSQFFNGMVWKENIQQLPITVFSVSILVFQWNGLEVFTDPSSNPPTNSFQSQFFNGMVWKKDLSRVMSICSFRFNPSFSMEWSGSEQVKQLQC